jgi:hypothetical protein
MHTTTKKKNKNVPTEPIKESHQSSEDDTQIQKCSPKRRLQEDNIARTLSSSGLTIIVKTWIFTMEKVQFPNTPGIETTNELW